MERQVINQGSSNEEDTSTGGSCAGTECVLDYTNEFTTHEVFKSRDALVEWIRERGNSNGLVIIIKNSDAGAVNKKPRIKFGCERGGFYTRKIDENVQKKKRLRSRGTKKCGCPFLLKGVHFGDADEWKLEVVCGVHNHHAAESNARRLSEEEKALLVDMSKSMAKPKDILRTIQQKDGLNLTSMKTIYNVRQRWKFKESAVRSQMHVLLSKLSDHNYIEWHRSSGANNIVKDLFWTHPVSVDVLRAFPRVLFLDCTCRMYSFPLLEIVGVTSTNITFSAAFAYLDAKNEDNYIWALSRLRTMLDEHGLPTVILTDKDLPLMNAIHSIFPSARSLLCRRHISRNVFAKCKDMFDGTDQLEKFMMSWNMLVLSETEHEYQRRLGELDYYFSRYPCALEYVKSTWLNEYKDRFVSAFTDTCMHFGHTTLNRVEGARAKLKQQLGNTRDNFETSWPQIHSLLELQHVEIKVSLEKCLTVMQHNYMHDELKELRGFVSTIALNTIVCESKKLNSMGVDSLSCGCTIRRTHGVPCVHEIAEYRKISHPIPLNSVDSHWRKLDLLYSPKSSDHTADIITQMYQILNRWMDSDEDTRGLISLKLEEVINMESMARTTSKEQPSEIGTSTRCNLPAFELALSCQDSNSPGDTVATTSQSEKSNRRPSKMKVHRMFTLASSALKEQFPTALRPYISSVREFSGDGNCGYRAIAGLMGFGDDAWIKVRRELLNELRSHETQYENLFGRHDRVDEIMHTLSFFEECPPDDRWLTMPDMGHIIASCYNVVLIYLSPSLCLTFLPTRTVSLPLLERRHIAIGLVNDNHFVQVFMFPGHPMPPVSECWHRVRLPGAEGWQTVYTERIQRFRQIVGSDVAN